jgi:peptidoglycan hydrolase-like protein with peptidoglycan-binding domain
MKSIPKTGVAVMLGLGLAAGTIALSAPAAEASSRAKVCDAVHEERTVPMARTTMLQYYPGRADYAPSCTLEMGDGMQTPNKSFTEEDIAGIKYAVHTLQRAMNICYPVTVTKAVGSLLTLDGKFGAKTYAALIAVQRTAGTTRDGVFGQKTRAAMLWPNELDSRRCFKIPGL